jgi:Trk-type K+ transport system membrane component
MVVLVQIGGLGILTVAALLTLAVGRRLGESREAALVESPAVERADVRRTLVAVATFTIAVEALATAVVFVILLGDGLSVGSAAWRGLFHGVMAFNNAGFALWNGALVEAPGGVLLALVLAATLTVGGLGTIVWADLKARRSTGRRVSLHTRITLWTSGALLLAGTVAVLAIEWSNAATLGGRPVGERALGALAYSASTRTGGFDMLVTGDMRTETLLSADALMFIGAGTGSTGGGVKVTTFFILALAAWSELRGRPTLETFGREVPGQLVRQAFVVTLLAAGAVMIGTMVILASGPWTLEQGLFEAVSAFSTTGLSTGITPDLSRAGRIVDMVLMFLGRVGPLTLAAALALRERPRLFRYPEERVLVG